MTFLLFYLTLLVPVVHCYTPAPRWGQATSIITSSLFVQGGKQDPTNSQSYTSAHAQSDLLYLPLDKSFSVDSPPWVLISDPTNSTESQGPAVAWHTLSAYSDSLLLLFGGVPSWDGPPPIVTGADSAWLLNVYNRLIPDFKQELANWDNEPIRRIHHAAVSAITGEVYIFGGEKADGSGILSDHWVFNPNNANFTQLPTDGGPAGLTGHAAIILPNGQILIFGGVLADGTLLDFGMIYIFDTNTNAWSTQMVSQPVPPGRRAFACVLIDGNAILIHGGGDAVLQNSLSDGWIYNITTTTWTQVPNLEDIGQRRDHFAVSYGGQVIFGFGYAQNGPANASLCIYDPASQTFSPTYTPPPPTSTVSITIPIASATETGGGGSQTGSVTISGSVHPTSTNGGGGSGGGGNNNGGDGGGDDGKNPQSTTGKTTAIAIGTVLGIAALVAAGLGAFWYMRRRERKRWAEGGIGGVFSPLPDEEGGPGRGPSAARMVDATPEKGLVENAVNTIGTTLGAWGSWVAGAIGLSAVVGTGTAAATRERQQRRDMLADEDTRDFGWYDAGDDRSSRLGRLRQGSGGSTWSLMSVFRPKARREGSAASGMSFGSRPPMSRGGSLLGHTHGDPSEKDPFSDDMYLRDTAATAGGAGVLAAVASSRPKGHRQASYTSSLGSNYVDPFADPISEQDIAGPGALLVNAHHGGYPRPGALSPVTEISRLSSSSGSAVRTQSQSGSSNDHTGPLSPFSTMSRSSFGFTSNSHQGSPALPLGASPAASPGLSSLPPRQQPRASSILDMKPQPPDQHIRRSDTWWARFASKSLLDRRSSRGSASNVAPVPEFRDPNPLPQRLGFVKEETSSVLRERSDGSDTSARAAGPVYGRGAGHGKSMSSIQTQQTADSAAIERMGGNVDVMHRGNRQSGSTSTRGSVTTHGGSVDEGQRRSWQPVDTGEEQIYTSPVEMVPAAAFGLSTASPPREPSPPPARSASRPTLSTNSSNSSGSVADKIKAYERRMSQDVTPPPDTGKQREERPRKKDRANYGLVARPSLFVANPDHRAGQGSGDSQA